MGSWLCSAEYSTEPISFFSYQNKKYPVFSSFEGHFKPTDPIAGKQNRFAKLGKMADTVIAKMRLEVEDDPLSMEGRLAFACLLMLLTGGRSGNEASAAGYVSQLPGNIGETVQTFGVTTLKPEHIRVEGNTLMLDFLGKKQVSQNITVTDPLLVDTGKLYLNDKIDPFASSEIVADTWIGVTTRDFTHAVKQYFGEEFLVKDLRTFVANITCFDTMRPFLEKVTVPKAQAKQELSEVVDTVAEKLGNTASVARSAYLDGRMLLWFLQQRIRGEA